MRTIEDFKVGDMWFDGDDARRRIIAIDIADSAHPVVARCDDGHVTTYAANGQFSNSAGSFDLVRKAPKEMTRFLRLYRNRDGHEIVETSESNVRKRPRMTGYDLVATAKVAFLEMTEADRVGA